MSQNITLIEKHFMDYVYEKGSGKGDIICLELQKACAQGNSVFIIELQKKLKAKDLMVMANKIREIKKAESERKGA